MLTIPIGYRIIALTEPRFRQLVAAQARFAAGGRPMSLLCQPYRTVDTDPGVAEHELPEGMVPVPAIGILPYVSRDPIEYGPLACTMVRHAEVERFFRRLTGGMDIDIPVLLEAIEGGFRLTTQERVGLKGAGGHTQLFPFEADEGLDQSWFHPPRDEPFLRRSIMAVRSVWSEYAYDRRRPLPPLPSLDDRGIAYELAPGAWVTLVSESQRRFFSEIPPALILDPVRYRWAQAIDPRAVLFSREMFLAASLGANDAMRAWEERLDALWHGDPQAKGEVERAIGRLYVEGTTEKPPEGISCRPFLWKRYVEEA